MLHTLQQEGYNPTSLAQEVGELVAMALNEFSRQIPRQNDEETFLLSIHGTKLRLVTTYFTAEYFSHLQSHQMPVSQVLYVRRSQFFEMKDPDGRVEALRMCIGLTRYILSGRAEIGQTRAIRRTLKEILWLEQKKHRIVCIYLKNLVNTVLSLDMNIVIRLFTN